MLLLERRGFRRGLVRDLLRSMVLSLKIVSYSLWHMDIDADGAAGGDGSGTRRRSSLAATAFCTEKAWYKQKTKKNMWIKSPVNENIGS